MRKTYTPDQQTAFDALLTRHGTTMTALASELKIPYGTLQNWRQGRREPPDWALKLIDFYLTHKRPG